MLADYLAVNGVEVVNTARADAYLDQLACGVGASCFDCPTLPDLLNDGVPYGTVAGDPAPWYDARIPESARILGFSGVDVAGLDTAIYPDPGNADQSPRGTIRDFQWTLQIDAVDDCALSYAIAWLTNAVAKAACSDGECAGATVCMIACCPEDPDNDDVARFVHEAEVVEGPRIVNRMRAPYGVAAEVEIVFRTPNARIFRETAYQTQISPIHGQMVSDFSFYLRETCPEPAGCGTDPECPQPPYTPPVPPPIDPCFPTGFVSVYRSLLSVDMQRLPGDLDTAMVITIDAGTGSPVRNVGIRWHQNPLGVDCATVTNGRTNLCASMCADVISLYQPAESRLVIDGRTEQSLLYCPTSRGTDITVPRLFGLNGVGPLRYPVIACGNGVCMEVVADADAVNRDTMVTVAFVPRQEAG